MAAKLKIMHRDSDGKNNSETFYTTLTANLSSDTAVAVDTWARAYVALSTDTYNDSQVIDTVSINEILAE